MGRKGKRYTQAEKQEVMRLVDEGYKYKEISEMTGVSTSTIDSWKYGRYKKRGLLITPPTQTTGSVINKYLLEMANGNDLTPYIGKDITKMMPREIYAFLRLLNLRGKLTTTSSIEL